MTFILSSLVGFFAGLLSSMGLGAGTVLILYLSNFTPTPHLTAQGINLIFFLPIASFSLFLHHKNKLFRYRPQLFFISLLGGIGALGGSFIAVYLDPYWLKKLFAVFLLIMGIKDLLRKKESSSSLNPQS